MSILEQIRNNPAFDGVHPNEITRAATLVHCARTEDDEMTMKKACEALRDLPLNAAKEVYSLAMTAFFQPTPKKSGNPIPVDNGLRGQRIDSRFMVRA